MRFVRSMSALAFVLAIGLFVGAPVLFGGDEGRVSDQHGAAPETPRPQPTRAPRPEPKPTPTGNPFERSAAPDGLANTYPRRCLRRADPPPDLVATVSGRTLQITRLDGSVVNRVRDPQLKGPVAWSPSGRFLALGPQGLFRRLDGSEVPFSNGEFGHGMVSSASEAPWSWSPIADCGIALEEGTLYASTIDPFVSGTGIALVNDGVRTFGFEPSGRALRFALDGDGGELRYFRADLVTGDIRRTNGLTKLRCRACSPNGEFRVVSRDGRLMLVDSEGNSRGGVGNFMADDSWIEAHPEWGPSGTGVLFLRSRNSTSQIWFLQEGSSEPRYLTDIDRGTNAAPARFDWSATPPGGRPGA